MGISLAPAPSPPAGAVDPEAVAAAYLARIGATRPAEGDPAALRELHRAHLVAVPYNTLAIHLGEEVTLDEAELLHNIVQRRRGGLCYELNGAFALLLESLGYRVELLPAQVYAAGRFNLPYSHIVLRVRDAEGGLWLADVGFGRHSVYPLALGTAEDQADPGGRFRLVETGEGDLDVLRAGRPVYRVDQRARPLADFEAACWWIATSPRSPYARAPICSRLTPEGGRVTLAGRNLTLTTPQGGRTRRDLSPEEVLPAYREHFGLDLPREPGHRPD
uniref:Orf2 n=1 Tax=Micromonospora sp. SCSIO 07395 TaxID=2998119 RepID=A0A9E9J4I9_9ACTN|nr:Orf2 [Micromonospora sp. SCSIO 07395]